MAHQADLRSTSLFRAKKVPSLVDARVAGAVLLVDCVGGVQMGQRRATAAGGASVGSSGGGAAAKDDFAAAYPSLFLPAMRLAYRMTGDRALAEDLASEALARAYARWGTVSRLESPVAWVLRVTTNLTIDAVRRRRLATAVLPRLLLREPGGAFEEDVAVRLALVAALSSLPRRQREAIALYYLAGLDELEVSRSLDISPSSVRTHVQRGLATLRKRLGATGEVARVAT